MLNYIKSEWFRMVRSRTIYIMAAILSALTVALNIMLYSFAQGDADYLRFATVSFSLDNLLGMFTILFSCGAIVAAFLYADDKKNGSDKNGIAYGISRESIFVGKCIISTVSAILVAATVLAFYIGSAYLLLDSTGAAETLQTLFKGLAAGFPSILSAIILMVAVLCLCNSTIAAVIWWVVIIHVIPEVVYQLSLPVKWLRPVAAWLPSNFLVDEVNFLLPGYDVLWDTSGGLMKCLVAGFGFTALYAAAGLIGSGKKEI